MSKEIKCFLCQKDITNECKVLTFWNFPHHFWNPSIKDWDKTWSDMFNGALCSSCAKKDFELKCELNKNKKEEKQKKTIKYKRIFWKFFISYESNEGK